MRISAIIPLYNGATFIGRAIQSIMEQDRPADEIIIVDDGSTDNGAAVVQAIADRDARVKLLRKENGGQGSARNLGIRHATGELIGLLDQDDFWYENHLRELEQPFKDKPKRMLAYVYSNMDRIDGDGRMLQHEFLHLTSLAGHPKKSIIDCLKEDMNILAGASLIDRRAFLAIGGFDERLRGYEDDDLWRRFFSAGYKSVFVDKPLTAWRIHPQSTSFSLHMWISRSIYFEKLISEFGQDTYRGDNMIRDFVAPRFAKQGLENLMAASKLNDPYAFEISLPIAYRYAEYLKQKPARRMKRRIRICTFRFKLQRTLHTITGRHHKTASSVPRNIGA